MAMLVEVADSRSRQVEKNVTRVFAEMKPGLRFGYLVLRPIRATKQTGMGAGCNNCSILTTSTAD